MLTCPPSPSSLARDAMPKGPGVLGGQLGSTIDNDNDPLPCLPHKKFPAKQLLESKFDNIFSAHDLVLLCGMTSSRLVLLSKHFI